LTARFLEVAQSKHRNIGGVAVSRGEADNGLLTCPVGASLNEKFLELSRSLCGQG
jgi:hypothetical protein